jgi:hypothetical protein
MRALPCLIACCCAAVNYGNANNCFSCTQPHPSRDCRHIVRGQAADKVKTLQDWAASTSFAILLFHAGQARLLSLAAHMAISLARFWLRRVAAGLTSRWGPGGMPLLQCHWARKT